MKTNTLSAQKKKELEQLHRHERDGRARDRIKAVLLKSENWTNQAIAQALRIHEETVRQHLTDWEKSEKIKPENGGSCSKLNDEQSNLLSAHLTEKIYTKVMDICAYILERWGVQYTVSGMTKWLKAHNFSYKKPKSVPAKADPAKQEAFVEKYLNLATDTPENEPILFMDAAHPTMATKVVCGWIKKGMDKPIAQTASRTRVNVLGAIELASMTVTSCRPNEVNSDTIVTFFDQLKAEYSDAPKIHVILDQSGYNRSQLVQKSAIEKGIELHYLPPYSPNLNSIERLWKVMNEVVRNNVFFSSAKMFRDAIDDFFTLKLPKISKSLRERINDNFQMINPAPSG